MLRKLSVVILLSMVAGATAFAQEAPPEPNAPEIIFSTDFGGSYLGVQAKDISRENMAQFGLSQVRGVAVEKVLENSPAAKAGLLDNDVILRFNGEEVTSVRKLTRLIGEVAPDHTVSLTVLRNGAERQFDVVLVKREGPRVFAGDFKFEGFPPLPAMPDFKEFPKGELPDIRVFPAPRPGNPESFIWSTGSNRRIGVSVSSLNKQLGDYFGVADGNGLLINNVRENSPAAAAGLRAGDVIIEVDGRQIKESFDLARAINEKKDGELLTLTIIRNKTRQTITVMPEKAKDGALRIGGDPENNVNRMNLRVTRPNMPAAPLIIQPNGSSRIL